MKTMQDIRVEQDLTQGQLAMFACVSRRTIVRAESSKTGWPGSRLHRQAVAVALGVDPLEVEQAIKEAMA